MPPLSEQEMNAHLAEESRVSYQLSLNESACIHLQAVAYDSRRSTWRPVVQEQGLLLAKKKETEIMISYLYKACLFFRQKMCRDII